MFGACEFQARGEGLCDKEILFAPNPKIRTLLPSCDSYRVLMIGVGVTKLLPLFGCCACGVSKPSGVWILAGHKAGYSEEHKPL